MRRTSWLASAAVLLTVACDPTGHVEPAGPTTQLRFVNAVSDAASVTVRQDGVPVVPGVAFGLVSGPQPISPEPAILEVRRDSDNFLVGSDTVAPVSGNKYTMVGLGTAGNFRSLVLVDDTVFADSGKFKVRFVHGVDDEDTFGLDLYVTAIATDISGITPQVASLQYGAASNYFQNDTSFRRLRVTRAGLTTVLLDTIFAVSFADSQVVTVVASDKFGGGPPPLFTVVVDHAP